MEIVKEILRAKLDGQKIVLATIIHTQGSIPSFQSSKMLIREDGSIAGTVGGGCVEAEVWAAAKEVLAEGSPRKLTFNLNADPRYDVGLTCGGTLEIYLELITPGSAPVLYQEILRLNNWNQKSVLATIVHSPDSASVMENGKLLVREDGSFLGTLGNAAVEKEVQAAALEVLNKEKPRKLLVHSGKSDEDNPAIEIALEPILPQPVCYILGAGHVGQCVSRIAAMAGFKVVVADDREQFANKEKFPDASEALATDWEKLFQTIKPNNSSYLIIVTRGHKEDMTVLRWAVTTEARYIGLIGSRRKVISIYKVLEQDGISREKLERVHAPIGVGIGALTPEEIAVSIVGELIAVRRNLPLPGAKIPGREFSAATVSAKSSR